MIAWVVNSRLHHRQTRSRHGRSSPPFPFRNSSQPAPTFFPIFQPATFPLFSTYPLSFHAIANSFAPAKIASPLFSCNSKLFCKNTRGVGYPPSPLDDHGRRS